MREADEKGAFFADAGKQLGFAGEFDENFLEQVARVRLVAREIEQESKQRRRGTRERTKENFAAEIISPFAPTSDPDEKFFREELSTALGELPAEQRAVVHLKLWGGLTFEEIAAALEIPPNTAASRYRYGLDKLRGQLRPLYEEMKKAE